MSNKLVLYGFDDFLPGGADAFAVGADGVGGGAVRAISAVDDKAVSKANDAVRAFGQGLVVGDDDEGCPARLAQVEEYAVEFGAVGAVEAARGLVGKNHRRLVDEGTGYGGALTFAAGEFGGAVVQAVAQAQVVEQAACPVEADTARLARDQGRHRNILLYRELRQQTVRLEHEADVRVAESRQGLVAKVEYRRAVVEHRAAVGPLERAEYVEQRRLSGSRRADNRGHPSRKDINRHAAEHLDARAVVSAPGGRRVRLVYVAQRNHVVGWLSIACIYAVAPFVALAADRKKRPFGYSRLQSKQNFP